ncbi:MAG: ankyrin repeat domain-containing protein [Alphaproteobacteria bacterium]
MSKSLLSADFNPRPDTPSGQQVADFFFAVAKGDAKKTGDMLEIFPVLAEWNDNATKATGLIIAAKEGHLDVVSVLCAAGADMDATDAGAMDAISYAACNGHRDVADYLIDHGADAAKKGRHGISAIDCARAADFYSFSDYLQRRMTEIYLSWNERAEVCTSGLSQPIKPMSRLTLRPK